MPISEGRAVSRSRPEHPMAQMDRHIAAADWIGRSSIDRPPASEPDKSAEIGDLWRILYVRRAWVLGTAALLTFIAVAYGFLAPPLYAATAQILIDPRDKQIVTNDVNPVAMAPDGGVIQVESQARVIESDSVLTRAAREAGLLDDPDFGGVGSGFISWTLRTLQGESSAPGTDAAAEARAVRALRRKLSVKRADKVFVVGCRRHRRQPGQGRPDRQRHRQRLPQGPDLLPCRCGRAGLGRIGRAPRRPAQARERRREQGREVQGRERVDHGERPAHQRTAIGREQQPHRRRPRPHGGGAHPAAADQGCARYRVRTGHSPGSDPVRGDRAAAQPICGAREQGSGSSHPARQPSPLHRVGADPDAGRQAPDRDGAEPHRPLGRDGLPARRRQRESADLESRRVEAGLHRHRRSLRAPA